LKVQISLSVFCCFGIFVAGYPNLPYSRVQAQGTSRHADRTIRRLPPSAFPNLPPAIQKQAEVRGCEIPQEAFAGETKLNNVISGEFAQRGQKDWAILCSKGGNSSIVVFWGKSASCAAEIRAEDDATYLQDDGTRRFVYSRAIRPVNAAQLHGYADSLHSGLPRYQGIEDAFTGKASTVVYCVDGVWKEISGAD
jgi:hypothetical protein